MKNPISDLKDLLGVTTGAAVGTVMAVSGNTLSVSTESGLVQISNTDGTQYREGDQVWVNNNVALGKLRLEANLPIYRV